MTTTITITGAGGQIGYALLFRIAAGDMLGDTPVRLRLLEIPQGMQSAEGAALELEDGAFPHLAGVEVTDNPTVAFDGCNIALLVGARPRGPGMERGDLLQANANIFGPQGKAIGRAAAPDVRITVVGNPANTNALIAASSAEGIPVERFTALTRLDENRARAQVAIAAGVSVGEVHGVTIWGNHSATQVPDISHATIGGRSANEVLAERFGGDAARDAWWADEFVPRVAQRGAEIIAVKGSSSVASAASAAIDHVRDWVHGTNSSWTSAGLVSHGEYGVPEGLVSSFPVRSVDGEWRIVEDLEMSAPVRTLFDASIAELSAERDTVRSLGAI